MVVLGMCPSWLASRGTVTGGNARPDAAILTQQGASMCPTRLLRASASSPYHGGGRRHQAHRGSGALRMEVWREEGGDHHRGWAWFGDASAGLCADQRCASTAGDGAWRQGLRWQFIKSDQLALRRPRCEWRRGRRLMVDGRDIGAAGDIPASASMSG
jgi:hypothetical protein